ncbi:Protein of unknown function (DUF3073) [Motilibacter peucedani]|uniref:DUF3073 family protein n=1 Tax=Motilibacter peucedani TaxID=598650 RepID=A0A420XQZ6_9ACTN|nr:DUF3073 domain-containing protein [Motilibacter peucedani]RKS75667.1 Protein of unknown function (DUF3073) [Motilibacter peucedani]
MGRGRAKAKQTKVARELKYSSPSTDYDALQRELANGGGGLLSTTPKPVEVDVEGDESDDYDDRWG